MIKGETILSGAPVQDNISDFKVMRSAAGWYIGTTCIDPEFGCEFPNSRETGYFATKEEAEAELRTWKTEGFLPHHRH